MQEFLPKEIKESISTLSPQIENTNKEIEIIFSKRAK
jgi:hypothetical protein